MPYYAVLCRNLPKIRAKSVQFNKTSNRAKSVQMAKINLYLDTRTKNKSEKYCVKIVIRHNNTSAMIPTAIFLRKEEWINGEVINNPLSKRYNQVLKSKLEYLRMQLILLSSTKNIDKMTAKEIREQINPSEETEEERPHYIIEYFKIFISRKTKERTKEVYEGTITKIGNYCDIENLSFEEIDYKWLVDFESWMQGQGNSINTRSIHLRNLRALFNEAIREDFIRQDFYPFRKFRIKSEQTEKRSLTIKELSLLMNFECERYQQKYLDIFLISFYCAGINMIDLLDLPPVNEEQRITYRRSKTGVICSLKIPNEAMNLIKKYRGEKKLLIFGEIHEDKRSFVRTINKNLQKIGKTDIINVRNKNGRIRKEKIFKPLFPHLTTYWARHTWATIAADIDIPDAVIDAALGHKPQYQITDIYIRRNEKKVDQAIKKVIDYVKKSTDN